MRSVLGKLRVAVVVSALLLVGGVAAFVVYGRHLAHWWAVALPKRLAKELLQESFNVSYSHSEHGKTVFTVHAAKEQEWTSGLITLNDVGIELYGRQDGGVDRVHGSQFEFDRTKGILRAVGEVYIDLAAPAGKNGSVDGQKTLHIKTSGLVFDQKVRTAVTDAPIEFQAGGMTGTAVGADYDSVREFIVLRSTVRVSGLRNGRPVTLTAAHAEIDRKANVANLNQAHYVAPGESLAADQARVLLTAAGDARGVEAQGHVALTGVGRGLLTGNRLQLNLNEGGKPRDGRLWETVRYVDREDGKDVRGQGDDLRVSFAADGNPDRAVMTGGVEMETRTPTAGRSVQARRVDLLLIDAGKGRVAVRQAIATGGPAGVAVLRAAGAGVKGRSASEVRADVLKAEFVGVGAEARVTRLDGTGHTSVEQTAANGVEERSTGDVLEVEFGGTGKEMEIAHAVQRGGFHTVRTLAAKPVAGKPAGAPVVQRGQAAQAVYDGAADRLLMSGAVQLAEQGDLLQADTVTMDRVSGDAEAMGNIRVSYATASNDGSGLDGKAGADGKAGVNAKANPEAKPDSNAKAAEPVHVLAARAIERKAAGTADFFGAGGVNARMWQAGSQVSAPVLSFDKGKGTMVAHGSGSSAGSGDADVVRTVLVSTASPQREDQGASKPEMNKPNAKQAGGGGAVRVLSHTMTYTDSLRQVVFAGRVRVENQDGVLTAHEATAYLLPAGNSAGKPGPVTAGGSATVQGTFPAGQVERIVAKGSVLITQTTRHASGEDLVYTAADRTFVLTGTSAERPSMTDEAQGTITGKALRFRTGDDSVQVSGGEGDAGRVRSDLRVKQR